MFECESDENPQPSNNCNGWGDCLSAGECLLAVAMNDTSDWDDGFADAYNRELEEDRLGRPLFPNEY